MFVKESSYNELIHYLHLLSDHRSNCVFTFRMVDGRVTRGTIRAAQKWIRSLGIMNEIVANAHNGEPTHADD